MLVRLLSPPLPHKRPIPVPGLKSKSRPASLYGDQGATELPDSDLTPKERAARLRVQLEGPCSNLRLVKIEARVAPSTQDDADLGHDSIPARWAANVMERAYRDVAPFRRLKVLVNPVGGQGKAKKLFESRVRPVLEAAGCRLDITFTTHRNHGLEVARDLQLDAFDAIACVSGDGMLHEILNGLAQRKDARDALKMPVSPVPTGSGNAMAVNLMGPKHGFNLALACLNIIKGRPMPLDLCSITQPASATSTSPANTTAAAVGTPVDPTALPSAPSQPYVRYYSFLSQAIGLMADVDLGTEDMRALGDARFVLGYLSGVMRNTVCEVDVDVKLGMSGTKDKSEMRQRALKFNAEGAWERDDEDGDDQRRAQPEEGEEAQAWAKDALGDERPAERHAMPPLRFGSVVSELGAEPLPDFDVVDPSYPTSVAGARSSETSTDNTAWLRVREPISTLYAGKIPYVARDLMQFPYALPGDGTLDVALQLQDGGRAGKLRAINGAETGHVVYDKAVAYLKVEAYRVTPRLPEGDKRLKKGGLISIDGERMPYAPFQVEVAHGLSFNVLSLYGQFCVPDVEPPKGSKASLAAHAQAQAAAAAQAQGATQP